MLTENEQTEIKSIVVAKGFEFKGIAQQTFDPSLSYLLFEKNVEGDNIKLKVSLPSFYFTVELNTRSTAVGVHTYEGLKTFLSKGLEHTVDVLRRKEAGLDVDE
jgi:hypothetical protein